MFISRKWISKREEWNKELALLTLIEKELLTRESELCLSQYAANEMTKKNCLTSQKNRCNKKKGKHALFQCLLCSKVDLSLWLVVLGWSLPGVGPSTLSHRPLVRGQEQRSQVAVWASLPSSSVFRPPRWCGKQPGRRTQRKLLQLPLRVVLSGLVRWGGWWLIERKAKMIPPSLLWRFQTASLTFEGREKKNRWLTFLGDAAQGHPQRCTQRQEAIDEEDRRRTTNDGCPCKDWSRCRRRGWGDDIDEGKEEIEEVEHRKPPRWLLQR